MDRLTNGDLGNFWAEDATSPMQIAVAAVLEPGSLVDADGTFRLDRARAWLARRLERAPMLRRRVWWPRLGEGAPLWVDDAGFDLARHVARIAAPAPLSEAAFFELCAREAVRPLDRARPLWRLGFVPGVDGRFVGLLLVLHHAVADGLRGVALLGALLDPAPDARDDPPAPWTPTPVPAAAALVRDNLAGRAEALARTARALGHLPGDLARAWGPARSTLATARGRVSRTELSREIGPTRRLHVVRRALAPLRDAGHRLGVSLNDLVLAAVTRGLRDWMRARGADVAGAAVRVSVPVGAAARNAGGVMLVALPVAEPDRRARLAAIARATREAKARAAAGATPPWNLPRLPRSLAWLWLRALRRVGRARVTAYVTNVPGPQVPLWLGDARLRSAAPISPLVAGVTLSVAVLSYDGALALSVHVDGAVPGSERIADALARELDALAHDEAEDAQAARADTSPDAAGAASPARRDTTPRGVPG